MTDDELLEAALSARSAGAGSVSVFIETLTPGDCARLVAIMVEREMEIRDAMCDSSEIDT